LQNLFKTEICFLLLVSARIIRKVLVSHEDLLGMFSHFGEWQGDSGSFLVNKNGQIFGSRIYSSNRFLTVSLYPCQSVNVVVSNPTPLAHDVKRHIRVGEESKLRNVGTL